jgi:predicted Ser/Thr protein kinase
MATTERMKEHAGPCRAPFRELTRENVAQYVKQQLRAGGGSRAELLLLEDQGQRAVLKDFRAAGWLMRTAAGPWLIGREAGIYAALEGIPGVPRLIGRLDRWALLVEHIEGRSCADYADGELPAEFFDRLLEVVEGMHARGVVHCDIKNRANIVVTAEGKSYLIDFASAFRRGSRLNLLRRSAFERFRVDDLRGVMKARLLVGQLWNEPDAQFAFRRGPAEKVVRAIRDGARRVFKLVARG